MEKRLKGLIGVRLYITTENRVLGLYGEVLSLVRQWEPKRWYQNEKDFQKDLVSYLRKNLSEGLLGGRPKVVTESRTHKIDIQVGEDVGIELKRDLSRNAVDRLIGQIERFPIEYLVVVICGAKSENAWEELQNTLKGRYGLFSEKQVALVRKEKDKIESHEDTWDW